MNDAFSTAPSLKKLDALYGAQRADVTRLKEMFAEMAKIVKNVDAKQRQIDGLVAEALSRKSLAGGGEHEKSAPISNGLNTILNEEDLEVRRTFRKAANRMEIDTSPPPPPLPLDGERGYYVGAKEAARGREHLARSIEARSRLSEARTFETIIPLTDSDLRCTPPPPEEVDGDESKIDVVGPSGTLHTAVEISTDKPCVVKCSSPASSRTSPKRSAFDGYSPDLSKMFRVPSELARRAEDARKKHCGDIYDKNYARRIDRRASPFRSTRVSDDTNASKTRSDSPQRHASKLFRTRSDKELVKDRANVHLKRVSVGWQERWIEDLHYSPELTKAQKRAFTLAAEPHVEDHRISPKKLRLLKRKILARSYTKGGVDFRAEFRHLDTNGDGILSYPEFSSGMRTLCKLTSDDLHALKHIFDRDRNGTIDYEEFLSFLNLGDGGTSRAS